MPWLDTVAACAALQLELAPGQLAELRQLLDRHLPEAEIWAYRSRANGRAHEGCVLVLRKPRDPAQPVAGRAALVDAPQDSALPILVEVHGWARLPAGIHAATAWRHRLIQVGTTGASG